MSWGERSCLKPCRRPEGPTMNTCNVDCIFYEYDGVTAPDSEPKVVRSEINKKDLEREGPCRNRAERRRALKLARRRKH